MGVRLLYLKLEVRCILVKNLCLILLLSLALKQDLKSYKIPNATILVGYLLSLLFFLQDYEWTGLYKWVGSMTLPILILFPLFVIKALGAGDIKLFSVIGGFFGITYVINLIAIAFVIGGILSLAKLIINRNFKHRFIHFLTYSKNLHFKITNHISKELDYRYYDKTRIQGQEVIHFSLAIFLAFIIKLIYSINIIKG